MVKKGKDKGWWEREKAKGEKLRKQKRSKLLFWQDHVAIKMLANDLTYKYYRLLQNAMLGKVVIA